jgi:hypothetical protein
MHFIVLSTSTRSETMMRNALGWRRMKASSKSVPLLPPRFTSATMAAMVCWWHKASASSSVRDVLDGPNALGSRALRLEFLAKSLILADKQNSLFHVVTGRWEAGTRFRRTEN